MTPIFVDALGITSKMNHREQFEFTKKKRIIPQDEKFEDWTFKEENYPPKTENNDLAR